MHSDVRIVAVAGRRPHIEHRGGVAARLTGAHTVHLVSAAATPLGGDTVAVRVCVEPGARLRLRSVAAAVALPSVARPDSLSRFDAEVFGELDAALQPVIVAGVAHHSATATLRVGPGGALRFVERVQIGRHGEAGGFYCGAVHADTDGAPLLRHRVELGDGALGADAVSRPAAMVTELRHGTATPQPDRDATVLALAGGGWLTTWLGDRLPPARS